MIASYCPKCDRLTQGDHSTCVSCGADRPVEGWPTDRLIGSRFADDYTVIERLGSGGFGVVYLAENAEFGGKRAVKVLHSRHLHNDAVLRRFKREAKALYRLQSPYTVRMERWGRTPEGHYYMIQEFAEGETLADLIAHEGRLSERRTLNIARQIGVALSDAHVLDILHRDLKPENIMVRHHRLEGDRIAVLDFGIAKILSDQTSSRRSGLVGTPCYMPPECWDPDLGEQDIRGDLWSVGVIAYEMLTGQLPFDTESGSRPMSMAYQVCNLTPEAVGEGLAQVGVHPETESIVRRLLQQRPADRYDSPTEFVEAIERHPLWSPSRTKRRRPREKSTGGGAVSGADSLADTVDGAADTLPDVDFAGLGSDDLSFQDEPPEWLGFDRRSDRQRWRRSGDVGEGTEGLEQEKPRWLRTVLIAVLVLGVIALLARFGDEWLAIVSGPSDAGAGLDGGLVPDGGGGPEAPAKLEGRDAMTLYRVPAGTFVMGADGVSSQHPHEVVISDFYLDEHEVTVAMWQRCVDGGACPAEAARTADDDPDCPTLGPGRDGAQPLRCVSWEGANAYCHYVERRLPTEAEWERAARYLDEAAAPVERAGNGEGSGAAPSDAPRGPRGLDGVVGEWVADWYSRDYYEVSPTFDPQGPIFGSQRVVRGEPEEESQPASLVERHAYPPQARPDDVGFRCAQDG